MPAVSVVIPAYNSAETIARAIDGVLAQTHGDLECLVVDDASTDDTAAVVAGYDDPRVRCVRHETNRGGSVARNTGIALADGEYVAFLDADDVWHPEKLARQLDVLEDRSDSWVAAYCGYETSLVGRARPRRVLRLALAPLRRLRAGDRGDAGDRTEAREGGTDLIPSVLLCEFDLGGSSTLLVRRRTVDAIGGFDGAFPRHQDWEFLVRLLRVGKLAYVAEPLVVKHEGETHDPTAVTRAKELLFAKFDDEFARLERAGYDVTGPHDRHLAFCYLQHGRFRAGGARARAATLEGVADYLFLAWSAALGVHARLTGG